MLYAVEKTVREQGGQLDPTELVTVEGAIGDVRTALANSELAALTTTTERLQRVSQAVAEKLAHGHHTATPAPDDVVDAEVIAE